MIDSVAARWQHDTDTQRVSNCDIHPSRRLDVRFCLVFPQCFSLFISVALKLSGDTRCRGGGSSISVTHRRTTSPTVGDHRQPSAGRTSLSAGAFCKQRNVLGVYCATLRARKSSLTLAILHPRYRSHLTKRRDRGLEMYTTKKFSTRAESRRIAFSPFHLLGLRHIVLPLQIDA